MTKAMEAAARALADEIGVTCRLGEDIETVDDLHNAETDIGHADMIEATQAAVSAYLAQREAEGFVMVPVEPTPEMLEQFGIHKQWAKDNYRAMIAARPQIGEG